MRLDNEEIKDKLMEKINDELTDLGNEDCADIIEILIAELEILKDTFKI